ncbi:hypothetical protein MBLNU13_g04691t1 [Cladosporium sp. NU13]
MQAQGHDQWAQQLHNQHQHPLDTIMRPARDLDDPSPPPFVSASVNGPVDPMEFYHTSFTPTPPPLEQQSEPSDPSMPAAMQTVSAGYFAPTTTAHRAASRSPNRNKLRSASGPAGTGAYANKALGNKTSHPVLLPSRAPGTVKDIANRFDQKALPGAVQPALSVRTSNERYRRDIGRSKSPNSPSKTGSGGAKLQKRRPGQPKSPHKSASTSFDTSSSFGSGKLSTKSQPHAAFSPRQAKQAEQKASRPLFGEITSDGQWNGNFQLDGYGPLPKFQSSMRRGSDGSIALSHGRSQSHRESLQPLSPHANHKLHHQRSRSDLDYLQGQLPIMPTINTSHVPILSPFGSPSTRLRKDSPTSRIPVRPARRTAESPISAPQSRASSSLSNYSGRNKLSKSPTRMKHHTNKENEKTTPSQTRRYNPPPLSAGNNNQLLSAKIVPPPPKLSPPLRSSRPRQPVSAATTAASRARAAGDRLQNSTARGKPSEQWMGKPYDANKEHNKRKIPELGKVDFAARRARIQQAISQNLDETKSQDDLKSRSRSRSRQVSVDQSPPAVAGAANDTVVNVEELQQQPVDNTNTVVEEKMEIRTERPRGLSLDTNAALQPRGLLDPEEPNTAGSAEHTDFEIDDEESPVLGRQFEQSHEPHVAQDEPAMLLSSTTYQPTLDQPSHVEPDTMDPSRPSPPPPRNSLLDNVMLMRQRSGSSSNSRSGEDEGYEASGPSADESSIDVDDRWEAGTALTTDQGSIRIMLDNEPALSRETSQDVPWSSEFNQTEHKHEHVEPSHELAHSLQPNHQAFTANGWNESPDEGDFPDSEFQDTPRKNDNRQETLKPSTFQPTTAFTLMSEDVVSNPTISRALDEYNATGTITPDLLQEMGKHSVDLERLSNNGGSNAIMIQNLLDSIASERALKSTTPSEEPSRSNSQYEIPAVTPDTPPDALVSMGTAVVFGRDENGYNALDSVPEMQLGDPAVSAINGTSMPEVHVQDDGEDFATQIAKANELWERKQRGEASSPEFEDFRPPTPPPKDAGYTPRSSVGPASTSISPTLMSEGLRISTPGHIDLSHIHAAGEHAKNSIDGSAPPSQLPSPTLAPPLPNHAPPPPPPMPSVPYGMSEAPQMPAPSVARASSEASPRMRKGAWGPSPGSSRPSVDSQRFAPHMQTSNSMSSFGDASTRVGSLDASRDSHSKSGKTTSPGPEQKRLQKRRHVIMELLNTENSYHQDLKIIEDIYKATVDDFVSADDKKTLFGNCDEIERFSLKFFDELRRAVTSIYQPSKGTRWHGKRGSISTTQSDGTASSTDSIDEEKDRGTTIGKCFLENMSYMEVIYGNYLKNHDAANQRLAALQTNPTVKCWLDECHNNASDITSAWDLDSLLVKPTQRISKYPLMLQQLLDSTPADHPDHDALKIAAKDSIAMLTRINESKKRTELVEQMIGRNNKGKESDVRAGLAKAFGRRSEKVKERIGMSETVQDVDFDALAHKFGGHYIRLQIVLRDVQDYVNSSSRAVQQISAFASALEAYGDVSHGSLPEMTSKWRRYGHAIRDLTAVALAEHKATLEKRVITPMVACIKLHENPQAAIAKRKKRIVDYGKCKNMEKRGEKPDRKTIEAADMYVALNEQLKLDLPKLYELTASLVRGCLNCFLDIQLTWQDTWQKKLRPLLEDVEIPASIHDISPAFHADYELVRSRVMDLGIINGSLLANTENHLSPTSTIVADSDSGTTKRPSTQMGSRRTLSIGSEGSPNLQTPGSSKRQSGTNTPDTAAMDAGLLPAGSRIRSNSSISNRGPSVPSSASMSRQWSAQSGLHVPRANATASSTSISGRPSTATANLPSPTGVYLSPRQSIDQPQSPRPSSSQTYFNARPDYSADANSHRFSGIFSSAMPPNDSGDLTLVNSSSTVTPSATQSAMRPMSSSSSTSRLHANEDTAVLFVAASLFEFNIDKARQEGGYPYLVYTQGEVFDVVAQKGELWLGKNQDDPTGRLGWLWEQHFVVLSQD